MFCFQIHARAYCTMNEKFSILHEAKLGAVLKISSSLYIIFNLSPLLAIDLQWLPARPV